VENSSSSEPLAVTHRGNDVAVESVAAAVRTVLVRTRKVREVKMFGGIGFMLNDNLLVGTSQRGLLVRVGKAGYREALSKPGARPMIMRGRSMEGYIRLDRELLDERDIRSWVETAVRFVKTLPPKVADSKRRPTRRSPKKPAKSSARRR
jgi:TfoX/Sxy family transcriptional regulator of competence genes